MGLIDTICPDCDTKIGSYDIDKPVEDIGVALAYAVARHGLCPTLIQRQCARIVDPVRAAKDELDSYV